MRLTQLLIFSFLFVSIDSFSLGLPKNLSNQLNQLIRDMENGKNCLPTINTKSITFCTGVVLNSVDLNKLINNQTSYCYKQIEQNGYKVIHEEAHQEVPSKLWNSFYKSTKWAETLHTEKLVFFKKIGGKIDCLHEFIHVLQWTKQNTNPLSPLNREQKYFHLENKLYSLVDQVEKNEKKGQTVQAQEQAKQIQTGIKVLKEYSNISSWLDEKDVYYFFFRQCDKKLTCNRDDWNTIIANLVKIKDKLPWRFKNEVSSKAQQLITKKRLTYVEKSKYLPLSKDELKEANNLMHMNWDQLMAHLQKTNLTLLQFKMQAQHIDKNKVDIIPEIQLNRLRTPSKEQLVLLRNYSKINDDYVLGKFICSMESNSSFIIITNNTSKSRLIKEYLHFKQSKNNSDYCKALTEQNEISIQFKTGQIDREKFESTILSYKVLIWQLESEIYEFMLNKFKLNNYDHALMMSKYLLLQTKLKRNSIDSVILNRPPKIQFKQVDNLPFVSLFNAKLVLDLGAMDSVIKPELIYNQFTLDQFQAVKEKTLQNVLGVKTQAPMVLLKEGPMLYQTKVKNSLWVLSDLKLPKIDGVLGLSFFKDKAIVLYPQKGILEIKDTLKKPKNSLPLQRDYDRKIKAIEFICPQGPIVRVDSGSQVLGDISPDLDSNIIKKLTGKEQSYTCGPIKINGNFEKNLNNKVIFGRDVQLNLGWPWLRQFSKISISLTDGWISFNR